jgi:hypothetical protein
LAVADKSDILTASNTVLILSLSKDGPVRVGGGGSWIALRQAQDEVRGNLDARGQLLVCENQKL